MQAGRGQIAMKKPPLQGNGGLLHDRIVGDDQLSMLSR
jgi:hypothetical protein